MLIHGVSFAFLTPIIERHEWYEVLFMMEFGMLLAATAIMFGKFAKKAGELKILFTKPLIAYFIDKETISLVNRMGAVVVVVGMVVLNL